MGVSATPRWHVVILIGLMAAQIACGVWTSDASSDTNRDIFLAQQIASGNFFPLSGPEINGVFHLGPLWYYLLAVAVWIVPNAASVTALMALISSTQFPLAYCLGRRFEGVHTGLLFALVLALPGFMNVSLASFTHPIAAIPALLFGTLAAMNYRERPDLARAAILGIACVFMLMAHPTLVLLAGFLVCWAALRARSARDVFAHGAMVVVLVAASIMPMLFEQWRTGFPAVANAAKYTNSEWSLPSPLKAVRLIFAILDYGPKYVTRFWLETPSSVAHVLFAVYAVLILAAIVGLVARFAMERQQRRLIAVLCALAIVQAMFLCAIRLTMPPWMIHSEFAILAALIALGLAWYVRRAPLARFPIYAVLALTTLWTFSAYRLLASGPLDHMEVKQSPGKHGMMDIRDYEKGRDRYRLARIPFRQLFAIGAPLCEPVSLYGHYGYLVDYTYAVSAMAECGNADGVQFGGMPQAQRKALFGLHESAWTQIGMTPARWIGVMGISTPAAVWRSQVALEPVVPRLTNFPRTLDPDVHPFTVSGDAAAAEAILVSHRGPRYGPFEVTGARIDGKTVAPAYSDGTAVVFAAPPEDRDKAALHWDVDIVATPAYVDVLTFRSANQGR